jgi:hypothetical protein
VSDLYKVVEIGDSKRKFRFNSAPENADGLCLEILAEIGLSGLQPLVHLPRPSSVENFQRDLEETQEILPSSRA